MTFAEDLALCEGMRGGPRRRHGSYKRFSPGARGVTVRLFSWVLLKSGGRDWVMTAKRAPGSTWSRAPGVGRIASMQD